MREHSPGQAGAGPRLDRRKAGSADTGRHSRASMCPQKWIPAFAGMTRTGVGCPCPPGTRRPGTGGFPPSRSLPPARTGERRKWARMLALAGRPAVPGAPVADAPASARPLDGIREHWRVVPDNTPDRAASPGLGAFQAVRQPGSISFRAVRTAPPARYRRNQTPVGERIIVVLLKRSRARTQPGGAGTKRRLRTWERGRPARTGRRPD